MPAFRPLLDRISLWPNGHDHQERPSGSQSASERTLRRDVERLRDLDQRVRPNRGVGSGIDETALRALIKITGLPPPRVRLRAEAVARPGQDVSSGASTLIIHGTPNSSMHMPNLGDQNVSERGMVTLPPLASASNTRSASATSPVA
jgi:hypothetical protein